MPDTEITAEFEVKNLQPDAPYGRASAYARVTLGAKTDLGLIRENNEDKFEWFEPDDLETLQARGRLYVVADGMGGHSAGQVASELAIKTLIQTYYEDRDHYLPGALVEAFQAANLLVWEASRTIAARQGMGTTLTALALHGKKAIIAHVGDSRAYLIREGRLEQITQDHSWVAEQVRAQVLTEQEASQSPMRNVITRCIGASQTVPVDLYDVDLQVNDRFLLCSDGLSGTLDAQTILQVIEEHSPSMAVWRLVDLANARGGPDNITGLAIRVEQIVENFTNEDHSEITLQPLYTPRKTEPPADPEKRDHEPQRSWLPWRR